MKKLLLSLILIGVWSLSCGFSSTATGSYNYTSGKVCEFVTFEYTEETAESFGKTVEELETDLIAIKDVTETLLKGLLCAEIEANTELTDAQKTELKENKNHIAIGCGVEDGAYTFYVIFSSAKVQNLFCGGIIDNITTKKESTIFTTSYYTITKPKLAQVQFGGQKAYLYDVIKTKLEEGLVLKGYNAITVEDSFPSNVSYTFSTRSKRVHSDAKKVAIFDPQTALYYHTWEFASTDSATITYWQTRANPVAWYVLALGLTALVAVVLVIYARKKEKDKQGENAVIDIHENADLINNKINENLQNKSSEEEKDKTE